MLKALNETIKSLVQGLEAYMNSPVHSCLKFSAVLGTTLAKSSILTRPMSLPPIERSKNTMGFFLDVFAFGAELKTWFSSTGALIWTAGKSSVDCRTRSYI